MALCSFFPLYATTVLPPSPLVRPMILPHLHSYFVSIAGDVVGTPHKSTLFLLTIDSAFVMVLAPLLPRD